MRGIILAAGRGSRMKGLTDDRPKCLTVLVGRPLLERQLDALTIAGIERTAVVRGYLAEMLSDSAYETFDNPRWSETNMVMSLAAATEWLQDDTCIVSYADIVYRPAIVRALADAPGDIVITYDRLWRDLWSRRFADPLADAETFRTDASGQVIEIGARAQSLDEIAGQYMGLLKFTPEGWAQIEAYLDQFDQAKRDKLDMTSLLRGLIATGVSIRAVPVDGGWCEVDSESDLRLYEEMVASGRAWTHSAFD